MDNNEFLQAYLDATAAGTADTFAAAVWLANPKRVVPADGPPTHVFELDGQPVRVPLYAAPTGRFYYLLPPTESPHVWTIRYYAGADRESPPVRKDAPTVNVNVPGSAKPDWKVLAPQISQALGTYLRGQR